MNEAIPVEGLQDWILDRFTNKMDFDLKRLDRVKFMQGLRLIGDSAKDILRMPFELDDAGIDTLLDGLQALVDRYASDQPIKVGAAETFTADNLVARYGCNEECAKLLRGSPKLVRYLNALDEEHRAKFAISPVLLIALQIFGTMLVNWILSRFGD